MKRAWINRKSYLMKILIYLLSVLLIPMTTIIVLNVKSQLIVKNQILLSNQYTLEQTFLLLDAIALEMQETCIAVSGLEEVSDYISQDRMNNENKPYRRYRLKQILGTYVKEKFCDIFVYYPQDNYVVSGMRGAMTSDNYYKAYYGRKEYFKEDFNKILNYEGGYPDFKIMNPWGEQTYMSVSMRCNNGKKTEEYVVCVVLDTKYFQHLLKSNHANHGGNVLLFDWNKQLLMAADKKKVAYDMDKYTEDRHPYEVSFEGENYIMQVYSSGVLRGYYAFVVPEQFFWEQIADMRTFSILGIFVCVGIGLILVVLATKSAYAPLGKIMGDLQEGDWNVDFSAQEVTEFEFLETLLLSEEKEKRRLNQLIKETRVEITEHFLYRLLEGMAFEEGDGDDIFNKNGISLCSDCFAVGIIQIEEGKENKDRLDSFIVCNVFMEIFNRSDKGYMLCLTEGRYIVLLNISNETDEKLLEDRIDEGMLFLENKYEMRTTIGYSSIHEGVRGIQKAYGEAQVALRYSYICGKGKKIAYKDIEGRRFSYLDSGSARLTVMLEDYVKRMTQKESAELFVEELFEIFGINKNVSLETVECFKFDVVNAINRIGLQCGYAGEDRQKNIRKLLEIDTLDKFEKLISDLLIMFWQKNVDEESNIGICQKTRKYIEENYFDTQLSLSVIGEIMEMSTSHLSKLYKEKYGISIAYDITYTRLKNAKNLLKTTNLGIGEIAKRTGFSNDNVFIKVFKKWEGITPGRYRELM